MAKTLAEFLKTAGVATTSAEVKTASAPASAPAGAPARAPQKNAAVMYDPAVFTTPEQLALLDVGVVIPDAKIAEYVYAQQLCEAEQGKMAALEEMAEEQRSIGALQYHGMVKESTAMRLAMDELGIEEVIKVAEMIGVTPESIVKRAEQLVAATPSPALVNGFLGSAARIESAVQAAAEANANTTEFVPEGVAGTRQPVSGTDAKLLRFTDAMTLPGNPGLNYGMTVDQGRGYTA